MSKLADIAATLATLSKQFAELSAEQQSGHATLPRPTGAGIPIPEDKREEIKAYLRLNGKAAQGIPMTAIATAYNISRPTLYKLKDEVEQEQKAKGRK